VWCLQDWEGDEIEAPVQMGCSSTMAVVGFVFKTMAAIGQPQPDGYQMDEAAAAIGL
jgi:hypothetical protein